MLHEALRGGGVPVFLTGWGVEGLAGAYFEDVALPVPEQGQDGR